MYTLQYCHGLNMRYVPPRPMLGVQLVSLYLRLWKLSKCPYFLFSLSVQMQYYHLAQWPSWPQDAAAVSSPP